MPYQVSQNITTVPLPAKACLNYLQQFAAKKHNLSDGPAHTIPSSKTYGLSRHETQLPTLLESRGHDLMHCVSKWDCLSSMTPTTASMGRTLSGISSGGSTSSNLDDFQSSHSTCSWKLEVKNTFINLADDSDDMSCLGLARNKSEPTLSSIQLVAQASTPYARGYQDFQSSLQSSRAFQDAKVQVSVGSALHASGSCKPCAWFWKNAGCSNGADCRHCHLCPEGEMKRRRKANNPTRRKKSTPKSDQRASGRLDSGIALLSHSLI